MSTISTLIILGIIIAVMHRMAWYLEKQVKNEKK